MEIIREELEYKSRSDATYVFVPFSDLHIGHKNVDFEAIDNVVKFIKETNRCIWYGGGDYCDAISFKDRRFDLNAVDQDFMTPDVQYRKVRELFEPIADKCIGLLDGNHDYNFWKHYNHNYVDWLSYELKVPYLTMDAYIRLSFKRMSGVKPKFRQFNIYVHHGWSGARTLGGKVTRIQDLAKVFPNLPLYCMSHTHALGTIPPSVQLSVNQALEIEDHLERFVFTGGFLRGYKPKAMSYVEARTFPPTSIGAPAIYITPLEGKGKPFEVTIKQIS